MSKPSLIFDVKRYAIHDGPGIRITIFFKGCPLSCAWCHNPEGMSRKKQKLYVEKKCIGAQECVAVCPENALKLSSNGIVTDIDKCTLCGDCAEACPTKAIEMSGKEMGVYEIMQLIRKETLIMDQSDGGVTFSGGEPLHHHTLLLDLLKNCADEGIHRCVDTTGFVKQKILLEIAKYTDLFLYDLKHMDSELHKTYTGVHNDLILNNLVALSNENANIIIRIPLIQDLNDDHENLSQTAVFIASLPKPVVNIQLLPYHPIALTKYAKLGHSYDYGHLEPPTFEKQESVIALFRKYNLPIELGG